MAENAKPSISLKILYVGEDKKPFDLTAIDAQEGKRLFDALPQESKARAETIAKAIANIHVPLKDEIPVELQDPGKLEAFLGGIKDNFNNVQEGLRENFRLIAKRAQNKETGFESLDKMMTTYQEARAIAGAVGGALSEYKDMMLLPLRAVSLLKTRLSESADSMSAKPSDEQLLALASVREAVKYGYLKAEHAPKETKVEKADKVDEIVVRTGMGWDWLKNSAIGKMVRALMGAIGDWIGGKGFDYTRALAEVEASVAAEGPEKSFSQRLDDHMAEKVAARSDRPVKVSLSQIDEVAGLKAQPLFALIENGGLYAGFDGNIHRLQKGGASTSPIMFKDAPLPKTALDSNRNQSVTGSIGEHGLLETGLATAAAARTLSGAAATIAQRRAIAPAVAIADELAKNLEAMRDLERRAERARAGKGRWLDFTAPEDTKMLETKIAETAQKVEQAQTRLNRAGVSSIPDMEGRSARATASERGAHVTQERVQGMKAEGGASALNARNVEYHQQARKWYNPSRWFGGIGAALGTAGDVIYEAVAKPLRTFGGNVSEIASGVTDNARAVHSRVTGAAAGPQAPNWTTSPGAAAPAAAAAAPAAPQAPRWTTTPAAVPQAPDWTTSAGAAATQPTPSTAAAHSPGMRERVSGFMTRAKEGLHSKLQGLRTSGMGRNGILGLSILGVAGTASAAMDGNGLQKSVATGGDWMNEGSGAKDIAKGDGVRGVASFTSLFVPAPLAYAVDATRREQAMKAVDAAQIEALKGLIPAGQFKTSNEILDRLVQLKQMQADGVKLVTLHEDSAGELKRGRIAYEGEAKHQDIYDHFTLPIEKALEMNLRMYLAQGGSVDQAKQILSAIKGLEAAAIDATMKARVAAVAAGDPEAMAQARMAANRGLAFAKVNGSHHGSNVPAPDATPMGNPVAIADMMPLGA